MSEQRKILLLNPPAKKLILRDTYASTLAKGNYYWPPLDLQIMSGILFGKHRIEIFDANVLRMSFEDCLKRIVESDIDTLIFLTGAAIWKSDLWFIEKLRKTKELDVIANGGCLLENPVDFLKKHAFIDAILLDYTSSEILKYLDRVSGEIDNIVYRKNGEVFGKKERASTSRFSYPVPRHELFPLKKYRIPHGKRFPFTNILTNFGCPHRCRYCIYQTLGFKIRDIENILEELKYIVSLGIKELFVRDATFAANKKHGKEFCELIIKNKLDLTWICATRPDVLDEELICKMKRAGCHTVQLGIESGDENILKRYSKDCTLKDVKKATGMLKKYKIRILGHFILGLPGEDKETILKTINLAKELDCDYSSFNVALPIFATPFREEAKKKGWIKGEQDVYDSSAYPLLETENLQRKEVWRLRNLAIRKIYFRPSFIAKKILGLNSLRELKTLFSEGFYLLKSTFEKYKE